MSTYTASRARRILHRVAATWSDLDYAQRRMFELRTGVRSDRRPRTSGRGR